MRGSELRSADTLIGVGSNDDQTIAVNRLTVQQNRVLGGETLIDSLDPAIETSTKRALSVRLRCTALTHRIADGINPTPHPRQHLILNPTGR
jgi:hypothetical protein